MVDVRRWNWIRLLPCALFCLMPGTAAAQNQPVSNAEGQCVFNTVKDSVRNDPAVRQNFDEMLRQVREQHCRNGEQAAQQQLAMIMPSLSANMMHQNVLTKCFSAVLQQPDAQQRLMQINEVLSYTMQQAIYAAVPRPLCP